MRVRRVHRRSAWLLAALVASAALVGARQPADARFTLAILRRDGLLLPFASYDDGHWSSKWPVRTADVPISLADVPRDWVAGKELPVEWTAMVARGGRQKITVNAPVVVRVHCTPRVELRSSYVATETPPPPDFQPYPKDGLAVSGAAPLEPIQLIPPGSPEAVAFVRSIADKVNAAETERVKAWRRQWRHPADEAARAKTALSVEVLAETEGVTPGNHVYYFEAAKKYLGFIQPAKQTTADVLSGRRPVAELCDYITFAGGWLLTDPQRQVVKAEVGAELSNCNREGLSYTLPLGAVRIGGRLFWAVQTSSWNSESYQVIEVREKDTKTLLAVQGGACG